MVFPRISVFTPTHKPDYLLDAYQSLQAQDFTDFEWVLLCNGDLSADDIPGVIRDDTRTRLVAAPAATKNIGALKFAACNAARGSVFVELDHDDMLMPGILTKIHAAVAGGAGFVYSDAAVFEADHHTWGYHSSYGWEHYTVQAYGRNYTATRCFPLSPRMLCEVYYAPDHVRAWSRAAYYAAGGHDPCLSVADDHDLICRTYLTGAQFVHIESCGYLYRSHDENTHKKRSSDIKTLQAANRRTYLMPLVKEWCRREGYVSMDLLDDYRQGVDLIGLLQSLPENSIGQLIASDCVQTIRPENQTAFFNAAWRAMVPGGFLHVAVPASRGNYADMNPLHVTRFNTNSFLFYSRHDFRCNRPGVVCRFDQVICEEFYPNEKFAAYGMMMIRADLSAIKDRKHPGPKLI